MNALEIIILSGFLGSGKTTLLMHHMADELLAHTAVIVNEIGQIDIDGAVLAAGTTVPSVLLSNGCVCCSMGNDLLDTIGRLQDDRIARGNEPFRRMIIECSGMSRPGPIIRSLRRLPVRHLDVRTVTAFDALRGARHLAEHDEAAAQLAAAHAVVLTHTDAATRAEREAATDLVRDTNPLAQLIDETEPARNARHAFGLTPKADHAMALPDEPPARVKLGHRSVKTFLVRLNPDLEWERIAAWLDDLASFCGDRLLRLKGFVQPSDCLAPVLVQSVGTVFSAPRPMHQAKPAQFGLVIITRGLSATDLDAIDTQVVTGIRVWGFTANLAGPPEESRISGGAFTNLQWRSA